MTVAFTGHRPDKIGGYKIPNPLFDKITKAMKLSLLALKPDIVISGMALGVDQWAAQIAIDLGIPFIAATPCDNQMIMWPQEPRERYEELISKAHEVVCVSPGPYAPWKMQKRNEWMVDNCDALIAVWDRSSGGTANCIKYAMNKKKWIADINPETLS